ncbi:MAG: hypothetical protein EOP33_09020 [Rickettsiaceae bacterium]|nr:MAG: hypothetical protein EOP33_09020 [Rickettsiaceae bacterium]
MYTSGQPYLGKEIAILLEQASGPAAQRYLDFTYQPLTDERGQGQGIFVFAVDVTPQVLARRQADTLQAAMLAATRRQSQERENAHQFFEQTPAAICLLREPDHRIDYHNPAYQALFPGQGLRGHTLAELQ